jgi:hypothetical protein
LHSQVFLALAQMGIDHNLLVKYEQMLLDRLNPKYAEFVERSNCKLDRDVRRWIIIRCHDSLVDRNSVKRIINAGWESAFHPEDWEEINVFNCIFLRFIDLSPIWLFRDIQTNSYYRAYERVSFRLLEFLFYSYLLIGLSSYLI